MSAAVQRVAVYGPESTGKTQLAQKLGAHFHAPVVAEYARERWDAQGGLSLADMEPIAREQWRREDEAVKLCESATGGAGLIVCDTDALTTMLWSDLLYGTTPDEVRHGAEERCRRYALYLLLDIDVPFAPDPQRCFPDDQAARVKMMNLWRSALEQRGLPYVLIRGGWTEREERAVTAVHELIARR